MGKKKEKKSSVSMKEITAGYEQFMLTKDLNKNSKLLFEKALKRATKIKQRGSK